MAKYLDETGLQTLWTKITSKIDEKISDLEGNVVKLTGDQTVSGLKTFNAPTNASGTEQATMKLKTANGGAIIFGKEGANSGSMIRLEQTDGTCRLKFRSSSTAGAMVWEQPESGSALYYDVANVFFRNVSAIQFNNFKSAGYLYTDSSGYLKKGTMPTALKNPNALTFGSKTYDGSSAQTINASDLGLPSFDDVGSWHEGQIMVASDQGSMTASGVDINDVTDDIIALKSDSHTHANKAVLDNTTASFTTTDQTNLNTVLNVAASNTSKITTLDGNVVKLTGDQTINGVKTFTGALNITASSGAGKIVIKGASGNHPGGVTLQTTSTSSTTANTITIPAQTGTMALTSDIKTYSNATTSTAGLMSATDKTNLDNVIDDYISLKDVVTGIEEAAPRMYDVSNTLLSLYNIINRTITLDSSFDIFRDKIKIKLAVPDYGGDVSVTRRLILNLSDPILDGSVGAYVYHITTYLIDTTTTLLPNTMEIGLACRYTNNTLTFVNYMYCINYSLSEI